MQVRYPAISVVLHWLMVVLIVAVYITMEFRGIYERGSAERNLMMYSHYLLGLSIWLLVFFRALIRLLTPTPERENYGKFQQVSARLMFLALYALMILMPVLGWATVSAEGKSVEILGWQLPMLIGENKDLAHQIEDIHVAIGKFGYFLIGVHSLAALYHHFVKRDQTLLRMLRIKD